MAINIQFLKKTIFFIGRGNNGKVEANATGFLISVNDSHHLVTAKHVVRDSDGRPTDTDILFFFNAKPGSTESGIGAMDINELKKFGIDWIFHENNEVDIAIIPFNVNPTTSDVVNIPDAAFVSFNRLTEGQDILFLSYQPGIEIKDKINPITRRGIISLVNDDGTFYIDGFAFPGNSGSPVFHKPPLDSKIKIEKDAIDFQSIPGLLGIIGEYIPYGETAVSLQTGRPRIIFEDNTGLSRVWSVDYIQEIIKSESFQKQLEHVKELSKKGKNQK